jgi:hypothetical protein
MVGLSNSCAKGAQKKPRRCGRRENGSSRQEPPVLSPPGKNKKTGWIFESVYLKIYSICDCRKGFPIVGVKKDTAPDGSSAQADLLRASA